MEKKQRNEAIDILRGIAVIGVLLGHAIQRGLLIGYEGNIIFKIIYSFHMPLFMLLSGYSLAKYTKDYDKNFLWKRFKRLILPTIIWSYLIYFVKDLEFVGIKEFIAFPSSILEYSRTLLYHPDFVIWFLYIVFLSTAIVWIVKKLKRHEKIETIILCIIAVCMFLIPIEKYGIPRLKIYFPIFIAGYILAKYDRKICKYAKYIVIPAILTYILLFPHYDVTINNIILYYTISISAIILLYYLTRYIILKSKKTKVILEFFSTYSLEIYLCQCICLNIGMGEGIVRVVTIFLSATILSSVMAYLTNKNKVAKKILYGK